VLMCVLGMVGRR